MRRTMNALVPREPARSFSDEFDGIFERFRSGLEDLIWTPPFLPSIPREGTNRTPVVDLVDKGGEFVVTAEVPGVSKENVDIEVHEEGVELRAQVASETKKEDGGYYYRERTSNSWYRRLPFPDAVIPDKAEAELKDGLLTLRVPKAQPTEANKARKVPVK